MYEPSGRERRLGAAWQAAMTEDRENLASLLWRRTFRLYRLDLSDPRQADPLQVYRLLAPTARACHGRLDRLRREHARQFDGRVPLVFPDARRTRRKP